MTTRKKKATTPKRLPVRLLEAATLAADRLEALATEILVVRELLAQRIEL